MATVVATVAAVDKITEAATEAKAVAHGEEERAKALGEEISKQAKETTEDESNESSFNGF